MITSTAMSLLLTPRVVRLADRALAHDWGEFGDRGALVNSVFARTAALPRPLQIAHALQAVCEQMPVAIAEDELIIGRRTMLGYPEHLEAIDAGAAEPGYMIADYPRALNDGFLAILDDLQARRALAEGAKATALDSFRIACEAVLCLAERHARAAEELAARTGNPARRAELLDLARICRKVPAHPAETFHEAVQSFWLTHLAIYLECESVAFSLGRMDQYLSPFYEADLAAGRITPDTACELLACLWVKLYENVQGGIGHVQTVTVAGVRPDGTDGVNAVSWFVQQITRELRNVGPSVATRIHSGTPAPYLDYVLETMALGRYMPQLYNDDQMVPALMTKGIPLEDAREYGLIGCHEPTICGKGYFRSASWPGYVCFQDWLEAALGNGQSLLDGRTLGPATGDPATMVTFDHLWQAFLAQMEHGVAQAAQKANDGEPIKAAMMPRPLMSALIAGCAEQARDFTEGGALYNLSGFQAFGLGTCVDSLAALRRFVYEDEELTLPELVQVLRDDWVGEEDLRRRMARLAPHWGTDDEAADALGVAMVKALEEQVARHTNARGGPFALGLWSFWNHVYHGKQVAASPDGRHHGEMMSHSMDPAPGRGLRGPTAALRSASRIDTSGLANGGSLLLEFQPRLLSEAVTREAIASLIRTYFSLGGIQLQLSAVTAEQLEAALADPDKHKDLVVRVAGYCDYFVRQDAERQAYILAREKFGVV